MSANIHDKELPSVRDTSVDSVPKINTIDENDDYSNVLKEKDGMNQEAEVEEIIDKLYQNFVSNNFGDYKIPKSHLKEPIVESEKIVNEYINAYKNDTLLLDSHKNDEGIIQVSETNDSFYKPQEEVNDVKKAALTNTIDEDVKENIEDIEENIKDIEENIEDSISDEIVSTSLSELTECPFKFKIINQINKSYLNTFINHYNPLLGNENRINSKRKKETDSDNDSSKPPSKKIKLFSPPKLKGNDRDIFCFKCHKPEGNLKGCDFCPRVFHLGKCCEGDKMVEGIRMCVECDQINGAEPFEKGVQYLSWCLMSILRRIRTYDQSIPFQHPVDLKLYPEYKHYILKPMCLSDIQKSILSGFYVSLYSFLADFKWIIHNSYIFNSASSKLTCFARTMLHIATKECKEIALCPQCYFNACSNQLTDSFIEPCDEPHMIVWAKLQGHPFWPAKVIEATDMGVHVRFFGDHNKAFVPVKSCFLFSEEMPARSKFVDRLELAIIEARKHITKLMEKSINFCYAPPKMVLDLDHLESQRNMLFPKNLKVNPESKQSYCHVENRNDHMKNLSETFKAPIVKKRTYPTPAALRMDDKINLKGKEMPHVKQYSTCSSAVMSANNHNVHLKPPKITKTSKQNKSSDSVDSVSQEVFHKYNPLNHSKQALIEEIHTVTSFTENTSAHNDLVNEKPLTNVSYCRFDQVKTKETSLVSNKTVSSKTKMNPLNNNNSNIIVSTEHISTKQHAHKEVISVDSPLHFIEPLSDSNKSEKIKTTQENLAFGSSGNVTSENNLTEPLSTDKMEQDPLIYKRIKNYIISNFKVLQNFSLPYDNLIKSLFSICDKLETDSLQDGDISVMGAEIFKYMDDFYEKTKESEKLKEERTVMNFKDTVIKAYHESFEAAKEGTWCKVCKKEATFYCCQGNFYCSEECQNKDWIQHQKVCKQMDMKPSDKHFRFNPENKKLLLDFQRIGPLPPGYLQLIRREKSVQHHTDVTNPSTKRMRQYISSQQSHNFHSMSELVRGPIPEKKISEDNRANLSNFEHSTEVIYMQSDDPGPSFL